MEAHTALRESEDLQRMPEVIAVAVEQTIEQTRTHDNANDHA